MERSTRLRNALLTAALLLLSGCAVAPDESLAQMSYQCKDGFFVVSPLANGGVQVQWNQQLYRMHQEQSPVGYLYTATNDDMHLWLNRDEGVLTHGRDKLTHGCYKTDYLVSHSLH